MMSLPSRPSNDSKTPLSLPVSVSLKNEPRTPSMLISVSVPPRPSLRRAVDGATQRDVDPRRAGGVVHTVVAAAAVDDVVAGIAAETLEPVVAAGAVGDVAAGQRVVEGRAEDAFDVEQRVGATFAVEALPVTRLTLTPGGVVVTHNVGAAAAVDRVVAGAALECSVSVELLPVSVSLNADPRTWLKLSQRVVARAAAGRAGGRLTLTADAAF